MGRADPAWLVSEFVSGAGNGLPSPVPAATRAGRRTLVIIAGQIVSSPRASFVARFTPGVQYFVTWARAHKLASRHRLKEIGRHRLTEVGLWEAVAGRLDDSPFRLSGGQQQLLCLARALAISPQVLLLDEPTSSLDPGATESIEALIRTLVPALTVVIVTHNLAQARRVSDRTMFVYQGHLVEHGDTTQMFENPAQQETAHYVAGRYG